MQEKNNDCCVYVIIPSFNRYNLLQNLLNQLLTLMPDTYKVIVVDESTTKVPENLEIIFKNPSIHHLSIGDNGFYWTGCVNLGINYIGRHFEVGDRDVVLLLNDDLILTSDFFEKLQNHLKVFKRNIAFGATVVDSSSKKIFDGGSKISMWTAKTRQVRHYEEQNEYEVDVLSGRGVVYPFEIIHEVGLFRYPKFRQCGDWDYSALVKKKGFKLLILDDLRVSLHTDESFHINTKSKLRLSEIRKVFFNVRSNFNLNYRYYLSMSLTKNKFQGLVHFCFDILRVSSNFK